VRPAAHDPRFAARKREPNAHIGVGNWSEHVVAHVYPDRCRVSGRHSRHRSNRHRIRRRRGQPPDRLTPEKLKGAVLGRQLHAPPPRSLAREHHRASLAVALHRDERTRSVRRAHEREHLRPCPRRAKRGRLRRAPARSATAWRCRPRSFQCASRDAIVPPASRRRYRCRRIVTKRVRRRRRGRSA
jgi:hypothetical protein